MLLNTVLKLAIEPAILFTSTSYTIAKMDYWRASSASNIAPAICICAYGAASACNA